MGRAIAGLPLAVVQAEWDQTLRRLREICEVVELSEEVCALRTAYLSVKRTESTNVEGIERVLFQNLLFAPWTRTDQDDRISFGGEWLWTWRRSVPWRSEKVGGMSRLAPGTPRHQWTYRFNVIDVEEDR